MNMHIDMSMDMRIDMRIDMRMDMCIDMRIDMRIGMHIDMRIDMHMDMRIGMCIEMPRVDNRLPWARGRHGHVAMGTMGQPRHAEARGGARYRHGRRRNLCASWCTNRALVTASRRRCSWQA